MSYQVIRVSQGADCMSKHTPGPWAYGPWELGNRAFCIHQAEGAPYTQQSSDIADINLVNNSKERAEANATRIVECVNALEGVENPAEALRLLKQVALIGSNCTNDMQKSMLQIMANEALAALGVKS